MSAEVKHLRELLGDAREAIYELQWLVALLIQLRRLDRIRAAHTDDILHDVEAEQIFLGAALQRGLPVEPSMFGSTHHALAEAVAYGRIHPDLLDRASIGYRRGLARRNIDALELRRAAETLLRLMDVRTALAATRRALTQLLNGALTLSQATEDAARELRYALAALGFGRDT